MTEAQKKMQIQLNNIIIQNQLDQFDDAKSCKQSHCSFSEISSMASEIEMLDWDMIRRFIGEEYF